MKCNQGLCQQMSPFLGWEKILRNVKPFSTQLLQKAPVSLTLEITVREAVVRLLPTTHRLENVAGIKKSGLQWYKKHPKKPKDSDFHVVEMWTFTICPMWVERSLCAFFNGGGFTGSSTCSDENQCHSHFSTSLRIWSVCHWRQFEAEGFYTLSLRTF